jgi:hypothetical protein
MWGWRRLVLCAPCVRVWRCSTPESSVHYTAATIILDTNPTCPIAHRPTQGDTLGAAVDDARQLLTDASKEVHDLTQQLNDAKNGRLTPRLYVLGGMEEQDHRLQTVECFDGKRWVLQQPRLNFTRSAPVSGGDERSVA